MATAVAYRVSLPIFDGPLDLLLHLIRKHELDVCDVALAAITDSYVCHVEHLRELASRGEGAGVDLESVGEFLVVVATLLEAKSVRLLPRREAEPSLGDVVYEVDPRLELVQQLVEFKAIKDAAGRLEERREETAARFPRVPARRGTDRDDPPPLALEEFHAWDLLSIFQRLMEEVGRRGPTRHEVIDDDTPIDLHAADLLDRVRARGTLSFRAALRAGQTRGEQIGLFLALLELVRDKQILLELDASADLLLREAPPEHRQFAPED